MSACRFGSRFLSPLQVKNLRLSSSSLISQSRTLSTQSIWFNRSENSNSNQGGRSKSSLASVATVLAAGLGGVIWLYHHRQRWQSSLLPITYAAEEENQEEETVPKVVKLKKSQRRFNSYASREYMGEPVMTPHDFLQCLLGSHVTARKCRMALSQREVEEMLKKTPPASRGSAKLFRSIGHEEPRSGIDIAFRMIDTDCSGNIDFKEFLNLQEMISPKESKSKEADGKTDGFKSTLVAHLFGFKTNREVNKEDFFRFFENLQKEVLELEISFK
ncbi:Calcium uptake protein 3, mitochondrial [Trichoplax sp. H2]|nr:Calcium uptake protein 3, mitochondrial [Trichoplax sp. H2]|eukprot:RDD36272.1 Calcium uptake protein 3, mitochondrial [Trichoplax sp. H2]